MARCPFCGVPLEEGLAYCTACGKPQPRSAGTAVRPSSAGNGAVLLPLAAAIIGIGVLVAAGTYLAPAPGVTTPAGLILELQGPWINGSSAVLTVSYANIPTSPAAFLVSLAVNGSTSLAVPMPTTSGIGAGASVSPAGYPFRIDWTDVDRDGMVSTLDTFTITPTAAQPPCCLYETFYVLRRTNGSLVAQVGFYGIPSPGTRPAVSLDYVYQANLVNAYVTVSSASPATPVSYLRFQLMVGDNASPVSPILPYGAAANLSLAGAEYIVAWYDNNYDSRLDAGDAFNVSLVNGAAPASGTTMSFYLEWQDGSILATATWTT